MDKKARIFLAAGFAFLCIAGSLLHFFYDFTGKDPLAGLISPVNESPWEHLKLLYFPALAMTVAGCLILREKRSVFPAAMAAGVWAGMLSILCIFYFYTGVLGFHLLAMDLFSFAAGAAITCLTAARILNRSKQPSDAAVRAAIGFLILPLLLFFLFTYDAPPIALFEVPGQVRILSGASFFVR